MINKNSLEIIPFFLFKQISLGNDLNQLNNQTGLKFVDLNEDVQILVLENLDFDDLLSFSETSQYFSALAKTIFNRKFSHKFVEMKSESACYPDDAGRIYLRDEEKTRRVLGQFSSSIYKLKVNYGESYDLEETIAEAMSKLINLHCADTLTEITINDKYNLFFGQITKPFTSVESVELNGDFKNVSSGVLNFDEIFPAMKILSLSISKLRRINQIFLNFPNFVELRVHFYDWYHERILGESDFEQILKMNPQIRSLKMHSPSENVLRIANKLLPNLEILRIEPSWYDEIFNSGPKISFKNVKILELKPTDNTMHIDGFLEGIEFKNLEELHAMLLQEVVEFSWWISFIEKNKHLKKFHSIEGCVFDNNIVKLTKIKNKSLKDISLTLGWNVEYESLVNLMDENANVQKFHFKFDSKEDTSYGMKISDLRRKFNDKWTITNTTDSIELTKIQI